jgi:hypothetical protein
VGTLNEMVMAAKKNIPQSSMVGVAYSRFPHKVKALFSMAMQAEVGNGAGTFHFGVTVGCPTEDYKYCTKIICYH